MSQDLGLRERKKQQTRRLLADTARRLFAERGFEAVKVSEVARAADVSEATVFNYFPTKEDLFYSGLEAFEAELLSSIEDRAEGESVVAAFARFVQTPRGLLATKDPESIDRFAATSRVIEESSALLARERRIFEAFTDSLAELLRVQTGRRPGDIEPWVAANALMGVHRALVHFTRRQILAGARNPALSRAVRAQGKQAVARLEQGLGDYGVK
jgi:AcrR family transcriptional regulator